ncbi:MAG: SRPBCC domain-containing protein [Gammaproteobacteria bacterium]|nr:SRPBCC domain-containing protein [Gammaproteobacteria bacterium]MDH4314273.1 SRPBCC domain-containing protein [Gammaproteobacteria bacterium]MDH5213658.1 SRPBCC domain-containing protein [Gammaproteobacteria bacterium]
MTEPTSLHAVDVQHEGSADDTDKSYYRVVIRAPIHKVWAELTRTDAVLPFFFNSVCHTTRLGVDAPVRMRSKDGKYTAVVGKVLEFEPPHRYSHTFRFTSFEDPPCIIRYVLKEVDGDTEFTLINENVPAGTQTEKYMTQGGPFIVENLKSVVETGKPTIGGRFALFMMGLTAPFTPKRCRSENWPL